MSPKDRQQTEKLIDIHGRHVEALENTQTIKQHLTLIKELSYLESYILNVDFPTSQFDIYDAEDSLGFLIIHQGASTHSKIRHFLSDYLGRDIKGSKQALKLYKRKFKNNLSQTKRDTTLFPSYIEQYKVMEELRKLNLHSLNDTFEDPTGHNKSLLYRRVSLTIDGNNIEVMVTMLKNDTPHYINDEIVRQRTRADIAQIYPICGDGVVTISPSLEHKPKPCL